MTLLEQRLRDALQEPAEHVYESRDLFERVELSIEGDRTRRRQRRRGTGIAACVMGAVAAVVAAVSELRNGELIMDWWILELLVSMGLVGLAAWLGPFIKRFGKGYAADVFRANPNTGKSFIVLTDFAYYLIFLAYIMFTVKIERPVGWDVTVSPDQVQHEIQRAGGIVLIIGILHSANLVLLPVIGRLLTLNRRLDQATPPPPPESEAS